ncbi:unnamed protein product [Pararhodospirillum photometricum DSM 122]|uniref:Uncharacterized protein n=1 Tax=Pararhodospirillum photometricum DSM 122 TaxID=1150469 RepID=H6SLP1_PARPM|nr:unnamed protein product [Pararhodospirillum photometricum DSM 122]
MGGKTMGNETTVPTTSLNREWVRASHHASGVPSSSKTKVVVPARRKVSSMASTMGGSIMQRASFYGQSGEAGLNRGGRKEKVGEARPPQTPRFFYEWPSVP